MSPDINVYILFQSYDRNVGFVTDDYYEMIREFAKNNDMYSKMEQWNSGGIVRCVSRESLQKEMKKFQFKF